jgi:hypothetical protein
VRRAIAAIGAAVLTCLTGSAANASVGDGMWALCVWRSDPEGAVNWLKMAAPKWQDKFGQPTEMLALRLSAECDGTPADPKKPNRVPDWKGAQQQLKRMQPKLLASPVPNPAEAKLCEYFAVKDDERALYLAEVVRVADNASTTVHQIYFDQVRTNAIKVVDRAGRAVRFQLGGTPDEGSAIRMPQDTLIASPAEGFASDKVCHVIAADGSLANA